MVKSHFWLLFAFAVYIFILAFSESKYELANVFLHIYKVAPLLIIITIVSWLIRYYRWFYLLNNKNNTHTFSRGVLPYISGFAFTATPGKIGELVRVRYFSRLGHKPQHVVSVFIIERTTDLIAVLCLSCFALSNTHLFTLAIFFVIVILLVLCIAFRYSRYLKVCAFYLKNNKFKKSSRAIIIFTNGIIHSKKFLRPRDILFSLIIGFIAWGLLSYAFTILLHVMGIFIPIKDAISIYPLSMVAGAASMLPGGVGSTESAIVFLLMKFKVDSTLAIMIAITIRIITLWMAILCGMLSMTICEKKLKSVYMNQP